jgi:orotate phosphoribosyltransferase
MQPYQLRFLELALQHEVLRFGDFELKSGRRSPYFFNAGRFDSGTALAVLGDCYAEAIGAAGAAFDMLFGPAYKGIPLATAQAVALSLRGRDVPLAFNRKEAKTHGETGHLIGAPLRGRVLIVEDVITAGTAVRESIELIRAAGASPAGVVVAIDRQERGQHGRSSATQAIQQQFGIPVFAIARLCELLAYTEMQPQLAHERHNLLDYRARFGVND